MSDTQIGTFSTETQSSDHTSGLSADAGGSTSVENSPNMNAAEDTTSPNTPNATTNSNGSAAKPLVDQAKQQAQKVVEQTQAQAGQALSQARDKTKSWVEMQMDVAADSLHNVASAVRDTGQQLRTQDPSNLAPIADFANQAAVTVDNVAVNLRDASLEDVIQETENFARRQPALFLGGVFALGFMLARFLKSSSPQGISASGSATRLSSSGDRLLPVPLDQEPQAQTR